MKTNYKTKEGRKAYNQWYYQRNKPKILKLDKKYRASHKEHYKKYMEDYYEKNKELWKDCQLRARYNMTLSDWKILFEKQNYKCVICGTDKSSFHVDHNHDTGKVRGILCSGCNVGLGHFKEDVNILQKAIVYLENNGGN